MTPFSFTVRLFSIIHTLLTEQLLRGLRPSETLFLQGLTFCEKHDHNKGVKKYKVLGSSLIAILVFISVVSVAFAQETSKIEMPPTNGGPGFVLPNSPLFFLDQLKQDIRVSFSLTAEQRARTYMQIANERLAEFRIMLAKNEPIGARVALDGVYDNFQLASEELDNARYSGRNVSKTAKEMANLIREHQKALDVVELQAVGVLKKQVAVAQESLILSKNTIEKSLESKDMAEESRYDYFRNQQVVLGEKTEVAPSPTIIQPAAPVTSSVSTFQP